jgi:membrane-associated phospholipid phosphatase
MFKTICVVICLFLALLSHGQNIDIRLLREINLHRDRDLDRTFQIISTTAVPFACIGAAGATALLYHKKDPYNTVSPLLAQASAGALALSIKYAFPRKRPYEQYQDIEKLSSGGSPSFPSGHTSSAFAFATSLSLAFPKWYVVAPGYAWACAVGYSRMDLGVHYPSDVLAGAFLGSGCAVLSYYIEKEFRKRFLLTNRPRKPDLP